MNDCPSGALLRRYRERRHLSKYELARRTGICHSNLFKFERGERRMNADHIALLILALDLEVDEIEDLIRAVKDERCADLDALLDHEYVRFYPKGIIRGVA